MIDFAQLSDEKKEELIINVEMEDIKMRNQDRMRVADDNYNNYKLIVYIVLGISSVAFGGTAFSSFCQLCNSLCFYLACFFFISSIITILAELNFSYVYGLKHEANIAKNDGCPITAPNFNLILYLIWGATCFASVGLLFLLFALVLGK